MLLKELKQIVDRAVESGKENNEVVVATSNECGLGARPSVGVRFACAGIGWEAVQFRLEPSEPVFKLGYRPTDRRTVIWNQYVYKDGALRKNVFHCPSCESVLRNKSNYCHHCGQAVQFPEKPTITANVR